jgi:hypothetical protein
MRLAQEEGIRAPHTEVIASQNDLLHSTTQQKRKEESAHFSHSPVLNSQTPEALFIVRED